MAPTKMLHIADPRDLLDEQLNGNGTMQMASYNKYEEMLYEYRLEMIDCLRHIFTRIGFREAGTFGASGVFIPITGPDADINELANFLRSNEHYKGVGIRDVA